MLCPRQGVKKDGVGTERSIKRSKKFSGCSDHAYRSERLVQGDYVISKPLILLLFGPGLGNPSFSVMPPLDNRAWHLFTVDLIPSFSQGKLPNVQFGFALLSTRLLEIYQHSPLDVQNRHVIAELLLL